MADARRKKEYLAIAEDKSAFMSEMNYRFLRSGDACHRKVENGAVRQNANAPRLSAGRKREAIN